MENRVQMGIRVPQEIFDWTKKAAKENHRSVNGFITAILEELMQKEIKKKEKLTKTGQV